MKKPRILHIAPANTSGVPGQFVKSERKLGYDSRLVTLFSDPRGYFNDICLDLPFINFKLVKWIKKIVSDPDKLSITNLAPKPVHIPIVWSPHTFAEKILVNARDYLWKSKIENYIKLYQLDQFDVYQLDGGLGFYRNVSFIKRQKESGKKIICCYTGSDLRTRGVIKTIDKLSDLNVTVEFDHLSLHPNIHHVFFPFDSNKFSKHRHHHNEKTVIIGHAPTNRAAKGSDIIIPILESLQNEYNVKMVLVEKMPYAQAKEIKSTCDIFVDQIGNLGYGINSLEALAMSIPCCSCLASGFSKKYPDHPFIDVNENNLKDVLIKLVSDADLRVHLGAKGAEWVKTVHSAEKVVLKIHQLAGIG